MPVEQTYANHKHAPRLTAVGGIFVAAALGCAGYQMYYRGIGPNVVGLVLLSLAVIVLLAISRVYTAALQDRIIRLEMRLRVRDLLPEARRGSLERLSKAQVIALRFASDPELPELIERAERESLSPDQIKREIGSWVPDYDRT